MTGHLGPSDVHRRSAATGRVRRLIHYPGVCGGPDCRACAAEQELAEREDEQ